MGAVRGATFVVRAAWVGVVIGEVTGWLAAAGDAGVAGDAGWAAPLPTPAGELAYCSSTGHQD